MKIIGKSIFIITMSIMISFLTADLFAHEMTEEEKEIEEICEKNPSDCKERGRFSSYQPNYAIWQFTEDDDNSLEAHYSLRYVFSNPDCMTNYNADEDDPDKADAETTLKCLKSRGIRSEYFVTYTGNFDFYAYTRSSDPVVNRISNPAFHYRKYWVDKFIMGIASLRYIDAAVEHRSNGQVIDADDIVEDSSSVNDGRYKTQVEFENGNYKYFDSISRSANYITIEGRFQIGKHYNEDSSRCKSSKKCFDLWLKLKPYYFSNDSNVTWGSVKNMGMEITDYDRVRLILSNKFPIGISFVPEIEIGGDWMIGDELFDTDSFNLNLVLSIDGGIFGLNTNIPLYMRYHKGPMNTLSNYTKNQDSFGIGLRFR